MGGVSCSLLQYGIRNYDTLSERVEASGVQLDRRSRTNQHADSVGHHIWLLSEGGAIAAETHIRL
ncbi:MAG: hypothetical protein A07HR60_00481 [uncultured archaeon A07HR60]|jgi:hypothetical protein|nr:MAG: hypothetical protein A07HR60_00481 [uncultured archaeon A07HR60]